MKASQSVLHKALLIFALSAISLITHAQLNADFTSTIQSGCPPLVVSFQDQSTGDSLSWKWDLGNGVTSTYQNPITTYFDPGKYTVKLTVKNDAGGSDSVIKTSYIIVYENPQAAFSVSKTTGCFPLEINFYNESKAGMGNTITNYTWDFGDGVISTDASPVHTYIIPGLFDVTLSIKNNVGCSNTVTKSDLISISTGVIADFEITSLDVCTSPASVSFKNKSSGVGVIDYTWDFGDGSTSTSFSPVHKYKDPGTYTVVLTSHISAGCTDTASKQITIDFPNSSFTTSNSLCANQQQQFTNTSVPQPVSVIWYFGDKTTSTELNPEKIYNKPGTYMVKLVNTFSITCKDSVTNTVTVLSGPSASFNTNDTANCTGPFNVQFTNTSTGAATAYVWNFGDGTTSPAANPLHTYTTTGSFTVTLKAINANGCEDVFTKPNYIVIQPVKINDFKNLPDSGCVPFTINTSAVFNVPAKIKKYTWDFGDGATSNAANPTHTYTAEGFFNVKLTIVTDDGCTDSYIKYNAVSAGHKPNADFAATPTTICATDTVHVINTSTNGPIHFLQWDWGPVLDASTASVYTVTPVDTGYRSINLVVWNYGCADTAHKDSVFYVKPPFAKIDFTTNCNNKLLVKYNDSSIADITHKWEFGDGKTDTAKNPAHTYSTAGTYNVKLIATNGGCTDSAFTSVRLINENGGSILLSDSVFCRGSKVFFNITGVNVSNIRNTTWNFGNGVTSTVSGTNTNYIYDTAGSFRITAVMTDLNGCTYTLQIPNLITVYGPLAAFYTKTPGICPNGTVDFTDNSTNDGIHPIKKWAWDYGDGTTQNYNGAPFSHTYNDTGVYIVKLSVTDTYGCTDSLKRIDYINVTHPYVSFSMPDSVVCPGKQVSFQNNSSGAQLQYTWNFGDGSQSNAPNPSYTYSTPGVYTPVLFATDKNECVDSFSLRPITVATPKAKFNMSDSSSTCPPLTVNFTNKSSNYASLLWNFGDGSTSNIDAPAHIYTYPGIYPAKLLVTGNGGCADSLIKNITIKGPTGNMTYTLTTCYPNKVVFVASAQNTVKYTWDFGDGATIITSTDKAFHLYDTGRYLPKMILSDSIGCNVLIKGTDTLNVFDVKARATSSTNLICDSGSVTFTDASESNDIIKDHIWIFEDSTSLNQPVAAHSYTTSGSYTTQLVSITQFGCIDTLTITNAVIVSKSPAISIQGDTAACAGANVSFNGINTSDTSALNWSWNFGNGSTATTQNANTVYIKGGIYLINLIAANNNGCADSISSSIKINPPPAVYAGKDTTVCQSSPYIITASGASTYTWISGENIGCIDCASTQITPANSGSYIVQGKDAIGCSATDSVYIRVIKPSQISASGSDTVCVGQTVQLSAGGAQSYQWIPSVYLDNSNAATPVYTAAKDTSIIYNVIGYSEKKCFSDTTSITIKSYPVPQMQIMDDKITLSAGNSVRLQTNNSPDITEWRWEPPQGLDNPTAASPLASPFQTTTYNCLAVNGGGCAARTQAVISVVCGGSNIFVPNTFSPNNDGMNDQFYARGTGLFAVKTFRIFNRWGQLVFEKLGTSANNAADGWNGMFNNLQATADVYIYMMEIVCQNNAVIPIKGNITLIR